MMGPWFGAFILIATSRMAINSLRRVSKFALIKRLKKGIAQNG